MNADQGLQKRPAAATSGKPKKKRQRLTGNQRDRARWQALEKAEQDALLSEAMADTVDEADSRRINSKFRRHFECLMVDAREDGRGAKNV